MHLLDPQPYLGFLALEKQARVVITDSGGVQEETTYLGVPCLTMRENTERPITIEMGTNQLIGRDMVRLQTEVEAVIADRERAGRKGRIPPLWDGRSGERIAQVLARKFSSTVAAYSRT